MLNTDNDIEVRSEGRHCQDQGVKAATASRPRSSCDCLLSCCTVLYYTVQVPMRLSVVAANNKKLWQKQLQSFILISSISSPATTEDTPDLPGSTFMQ